jgi:hypothetical protein
MVLTLGPQINANHNFASATRTILASEILRVPGSCLCLYVLFLRSLSPYACCSNRCSARLPSPSQKPVKHLITQTITAPRRLLLRHHVVFFCEFAEFASPLARSASSFRSMAVLWVWIALSPTMHARNNFTSGLTVTKFGYSSASSSKHFFYVSGLFWK